MEQEEKNYYELKADKIYNMFVKKIDANLTDYIPFINVPFSKSMIRVRYEYDMDNDVTEDEIIDATIDQSIDNLIYSSLIKCTIMKEIRIDEINLDEIKSIIDKLPTIDLGPKKYSGTKDMIKILNTYQYLF